MNTKDLLQKYLSAKVIERLTAKLTAAGDKKFKLVENAGSVTPLLIGAMRVSRPGVRVVVLNDREEAAYFYNDLITFTDEKKVAFLPSSYRRMIKDEEKDNDSVLVRTEVLNNISNGIVDTLVTFPEALAERVVDRQVLGKMSMVVKRGDKISMSFVENLLVEYGFERSDFVYEPGQFSIRGSIVDVYSFAEELPARIDFFGDEVDSIRFFDVETQLSDRKVEQVSIVPDLSGHSESGSFKHTDLFTYFAEKPVWWVKNGLFLHDKVRKLHEEVGDELIGCAEDLLKYMEECPVVEWGPDLYFRGEVIEVGVRRSRLRTSTLICWRRLCNRVRQTDTSFISALTMRCRFSVFGIFSKIKGMDLSLSGWKVCCMRDSRMRRKSCVSIRNIRFSIVITSINYRLRVCVRDVSRLR